MKDYAWMNEEMKILYDAIVALSMNESVFEVIPDVPDNKINEWSERLLGEGFYINVDPSGGETNIYYASPDFVERNYGDEYTTNGWSD